VVQEIKCKFFKTQETKTQRTRRRRNREKKQTWKEAREEMNIVTEDE